MEKVQSSFIDTLKSKNQIFKDDEMILFIHPKQGRLKAKVLRTEYLANMGNTCSIIVYTDNDEKKIMVINEKFLQKLVRNAA